MTLMESGTQPEARPLMWSVGDYVTIRVDAFTPGSDRYRVTVTHLSPSKPATSTERSFALEGFDRALQLAHDLDELVTPVWALHSQLTAAVVSLDAALKEREPPLIDPDALKEAHT